MTSGKDETSPSHDGVGEPRHASKPSRSVDPTRLSPRRNGQRKRRPAAYDSEAYFPGITGKESLDLILDSMELGDLRPQLARWCHTRLPLVVRCAPALSNEQSVLVLVSLLSQQAPPATDRFHRKLGGVVCDPHRHAGLVMVQIIDTIRNCLSEFRVRKIVSFHLHRFPFATIRFAGIIQTSQHFFLLCVNRQRRFTTSSSGLDPLGDVLELGIPIPVLGSLASFAVRLRTEARRFQELSYRPVTHFEAIRLERACQCTNA
jgi:hypothetical protein